MPGDLKKKKSAEEDERECFNTFRRLSPETDMRDLSSKQGCVTADSQPYSPGGRLSAWFHQVQPADSMSSTGRPLKSDASGRSEDNRSGTEGTGFKLEKGYFAVNKN